VAVTRSSLWGEGQGRDWEDESRSYSTCLSYKPEGIAEVYCGPRRSLTNPISFPRNKPLFSIIYNFFTLLVISWPTPYLPLENTLWTTFERKN